MNPNQPLLNNYDNLYPSQDTPDPLYDFLSQLLLDIPDALLTSTPTSYPSASAPALAPAPAPLPVPDPHLTCHWISRHHPHLICGAPLPPDPKHACAHFRLAHDIRGNEKITTRCLWYACDAPPMQRGSVIRHVLTVHLRLLRWQCEACGKVLSRKGTEHACNSGHGV